MTRVDQGTAEDPTPSSALCNKVAASLRKNNTTCTVKMVKDVCLNGTVVNTNNYSSPVPLVGLYIAAASMVCFLLIFCDVWAGFRHRKHWFPCRFFTINSATITLISIATKIPVDLTTTMPSALDQLSKLFGTVFICVAMSFILPSAATNSEFESYANAISLTIFVITVVVNICIQLATGLIFNFIAEHIIILVCMLLLLIRFWLLVIDLSALKSDYADQSVDLIQKGDGSMLARLKLCYMYSYHCCPQLYASRVIYLGDAAVVCMTCSIVLVEGILRAYRSEDLRFCKGFSDYGWSMWLVVASQSLTVAVVTLAMGGRCLFHFSHFPMFGSLDEADPYIQFQYLFSLRKLPKFVEKSFRFVIFLPLFVFNLFLVLVCLLGELAFWTVLVLCGTLCSLLHMEDTSDENFEVFHNQLESCNVVVEDWKVRNGVADMERCVEINKRASPRHITKLLSDVPPSRESSFSIGLNGQGIKISSLHLVLLMEMSKLVQTPHSHDKVPLSNILDEVFEIIHFIDNKLNVSSSTSRLDLMMASVIHQYSLVCGLDEFVLIQRGDSYTHKVEFRIEPKTEWLVDGVPMQHLHEATRLLNDHLHYLSGECSIEQLFVDMLVTFLAQLPVAIYKHILDSPVEEYEERVRLSLSFMCKLESLKSHVSFSLPPGGNITSLFDTRASLSNMHVQGGLGATDPSPIVEGGKIQDGAQVPEQQV